MNLLSRQDTQEDRWKRFLRLFGGLLSWVYHCFDRIAIFGYLPLLSRPEHIVCFFRDVAGVGASTKDVLGKCTGDDNRCWVESFARNHNIPTEWAEKGVRKEDYTRRALRRIELQKRFGVYFILQRMEAGTSFRSAAPKYPTGDPDYRILHRQRCRLTHYYCCVRGEELGALVLCVASLLPFHTTYYLNGHHFIERELAGRGVRYRKNDNSFLGCAGPGELQAAADRLNAKQIQKQLDYWTFIMGGAAARCRKRSWRPTASPSKPARWGSCARTCAS